MNPILKTAVLSSALALCMTLFGCATSASSGDPAQADTAAAITPTSGSVCDQFCQSQGGQFYLSFPAFSQTACNQKGGDWFTADDGYPGPPPGCCCKCGLLTGGGCL